MWIEIVLLGLVIYLYMMAGAGVSLAWYERSKSVREVLLIFLIWPAVPTYLITRELLKTSISGLAWG